MKEQCDVLVIGAGPSGCVAANILQKNGLSAIVVEKASFPRFVIGESLLPRCMVALEEAGLLDAVKEQHFQEKFGALFVQNDKRCEFNFADQFTEGWTWTWQVPRSDFDAALAKKSIEKGIDVRFEHEVKAISFNGSNSLVQIGNVQGDEYEIEAKFVIDSSGYGRVLPRLLSLDKPSNLPPRQSTFVHLKDTRRPTDTRVNQIIIVDHEPGVWIWMIPFSNGLCSVGYVSEPKFFEQFSGTEEEVMRSLIDKDPHLKARFEGNEFMWKPRTIKGYSIGVKQIYGEGFALTGNAAEFLDPVFSSGVTFAVESGMRAAQLATKQLKGETVNWEQDYAAYIMKGVEVFRSYVMAWYEGDLQKIFFADNIDPQIKKMICSVLAGYVWDESNYYVKNHQRAIKTLAKVVEMY